MGVRVRIVDLQTKKEYKGTIDDSNNRFVVGMPVNILIDGAVVMHIGAIKGYVLSDSRHMAYIIDNIGKRFLLKVIE